jgi:hypothetical protein
MSVTFDNVTPGIALSANEAQRLRGQIESLIVGMGLHKGGYNIPDFRDDRGQKRVIQFTVTNINNGNDIHVNLTNMT